MGLPVASVNSSPDKKKYQDQKRAKRIEMGIDHPKYVININLEKDFRDYAHACKRLLSESDCPGLTLIGCGRAITRLLKISQIMGEYFSELHMMQSFRFVKCRTCESKHLNILNNQDELCLL
jgi:hypothetical protein